MYNHHLRITISTVFGMILGVFCWESKSILQIVPNVQILSFLILLLVTVTNKRVGLIMVNTFCGLNLVHWGLNFFTVIYFLIFNLFWLLGWLTCGLTLKSVRWALFFWPMMAFSIGGLFAFAETLLWGWQLGFVWWVDGLWFDFNSWWSTFMFTYLFYHPLLKFFHNDYLTRYRFLFNPLFLKY